jgi:endonuclease YncB( thermonuclease family)
MLLRLLGGSSRRQRGRGGNVSARPPSGWARTEPTPPIIFRPNEQAPERIVVRTTVETRVVVEQSPRPQVLRGRCWVIDGDTIMIGNTRLRLAGIDAPELDHPYGKQSKWALVQMCKGQTVTAHIRPELSYDRLVAECYLPDGRDLAAELVRRGLALDWPKFSGGKYRHLETDDARRRLWRADARQRGLLRQQTDD